MHALSIDGDDQVLAAAQLRARRLPAGYRPHVERDLDQTLELLGALDVSATFFVNAQYFPKDVSPLERIVSAGHRLGSHSFLHRNVRRQSLAEFREDVKWSLDLLLPVQASIPGYRPPGFTMPCQERYFTVLTEPGFQLHLGGYRFEQRTRAECRGSNVGGRRPPARADLKHWSWRRHHGSNWLLRRLAIAAGKPLLGARRAMAAGEAFFTTTLTRSSWRGSRA